MLRDEVRLRHIDVDLAVIWQIVSQDVPRLTQQIRTLLKD